MDNEVLRVRKGTHCVPDFTTMMSNKGTDYDVNSSNYSIRLISAEVDNIVSNSE